jgi:hypothetical protein
LFDAAIDGDGTQNKEGICVVARNVFLHVMWGNARGQSLLKQLKQAENARFFDYWLMKYKI